MKILASESDTRAIDAQYARHGRHNGIDSGVAMSANGTKRLVVGLGSTGLSVARYLHGAGRSVLVLDSRPEPPAIGTLRAEMPDVPVVLDGLDARWLAGIAEVVVSPGVPAETGLLVEARRRGIPVVGDVELFARAVTKPVIAVTGSNGKSTVATLSAEILRAQGFSAPAGGNLGPPALELLGDDVDCYVLELSSFQMETTDSLRPIAAAVLNVSADHLDRHRSIEEYAALKAKLLDGAERAVVNLDDARVRRMGERHRHAIAYSATMTLDNGYSVVEREGESWLARNRQPIMPVADLALGGAGAVSNALASLALTEAFAGDAGADSAVGALRRFAGLPHRCQRVAERAGIVFVDDSKGTNVDATLAAIRSTSKPIVLIAGGLAKNADFGGLAEARGRLKAAILIGEAADAMAAALAGVCPVERAGGMGEAVRRARAVAAAGDVVLLSPACSSQDMFADYRARGELFARAVEELAE